MYPMLQPEKMRSDGKMRKRNTRLGSVRRSAPAVLVVTLVVVIFVIAIILLVVLLLVISAAAPPAAPAGRLLVLRRGGVVAGVCVVILCVVVRVVISAAATAGFAFVAPRYDVPHAYTAPRQARQLSVVWVELSRIWDTITAACVFLVAFVALGTLLVLLLFLPEFSLCNPILDAPPLLGLGDIGPIIVFHL